jgi:predicted Zn-dependent protease
MRTNNYLLQFKQLLKRVTVYFVSKTIIIIFTNSQLSLNSQINKEIESTSHDKRTLINDGYIYF